MEEVVNNEYEDEREITPENEYEGVIHRDMTENEKETIRDTLDKVIEECPDDTSPVEMQDCVNDEVYDENQKNDEEKEENETTESESTTFGEGKGVNDERGGKYIALVEEAKKIQDQVKNLKMKNTIQLVILMHPLFQVTGFMIFLINIRKSSLNVQFFG